MGDELKLHASLGMGRRKEAYKLCVIRQSRRAAVVEHTWYCSDSVGVRTHVEYVTQGRNVGYSVLRKTHKTNQLNKPTSKQKPDHQKDAAGYRLAF